jgi:amidohydrolase
MRSLRALLTAIVLGSAAPIGGAAPPVSADPDVDRALRAIEPKVIAWRRDIHQHPELSNREFRTAELVAAHLRRLGIEVRTGVAHTGVVGILRGARPGGVVALRADMDALPVEEQVDLPFASHARAQFEGREVGVMHACGHDTHTAMLMGAAEVLAALRERLAGTVVLVFQPAEEGAPEGEEGGARLMIKEGLLERDPRPTAIFGLHVWPGEPGTISYRARGSMAAADRLHIVIHGIQTHGAQPWHGVDPIIVAAQIMTGLQMIPSRQLNSTTAPSVITIGSIHGGVRGNIIPDRVELDGTIRTFDPGVREELLLRARRTATDIAASAGATADIQIEPYAPVTYNDPQLAVRMRPTLERAAGAHNVREMDLVMGSEDFSWYTEKIPGLYAFLGINRPGVPAGQAADNHSPLFFVNEDALATGVRMLVMLAMDYLGSPD